MNLLQRKIDFLFFNLLFFSMPLHTMQQLRLEEPQQFYTLHNRRQSVIVNLPPARVPARSPSPRPNGNNFLGKNEVLMGQLDNLKTFVTRYPQMLQHNGNDLLCCASLHGRFEIVKYLLDKGVSAKSAIINRFGQTNSALEEAANGCLQNPEKLSEYYNIGVLLLKHGAEKTIFVEQVANVLQRLGKLN